MIAAYLNKTPEEVALATTFNALKVFGLSGWRSDRQGLEPERLWFFAVYFLTWRSLLFLYWKLFFQDCVSHIPLRNAAVHWYDNHCDMRSPAPAGVHSLLLCLNCAASTHTAMASLSISFILFYQVSHRKEGRVSPQQASISTCCHNVRVTFLPRLILFIAYI